MATMEEHDTWSAEQIDGSWSTAELEIRVLRCKERLAKTESKIANTEKRKATNLLAADWIKQDIAEQEKLLKQRDELDKGYADYLLTLEQFRETRRGSLESAIRLLENRRDRDNQQ